MYKRIETMYKRAENGGGRGKRRTAAMRGGLKRGSRQAIEG
jgi:hypothetical protein